MRIPFSTNRLDTTAEAIEASPFIPLTEVARYKAPKATIDKDQSKTWLRRAWPVLASHKGMFSLALGMSFISLLTQVQIPRLLGTAINQIDSTPLSHYAYLWDPLESTCRHASLSIL